VDVNSCANESIITGDVAMQDYDIVIWYLGDESTIDETFSAPEQNKVKDFLTSGGKMLVTGSEIGWDLDQKGSTTDKDFYHNYLKAAFVEDGATGRSPARGLSGTGFEGVTLHYGLVYEEDYPDAISPADGAESIMNYNQGSISGIGYRGIFGSGTQEGGMVNIGFPIETVEDKWELKYFFERFLNYFDITTSTDDLVNKNNGFEVFPTVFSNSISVLSGIDTTSPLSISVYNIKGERVYSTKTNISRGEKKEILLNSLSNGIYILKLKSENQKWSYKLVKQ
ncbi:MAG TPA: T9SS type A sorting domain-containing protein, partial [Bacteroidetes bacterium]|nr:T9SS type A sorting domain-containing protein [Bacteroidota bacterium]